MTDETSEDELPESSRVEAVFVTGISVVAVVAAVAAGFWFVNNAAILQGPEMACSDVPVETATDAETVLLYDAEPDGFFDDTPGSGYFAVFPNGTYAATGPLQSFDGTLAQHYTDLSVVTGSERYLLVDQNDGEILRGPANQSDSSLTFFETREEYDIYDRCEVQVA
ncbi:hypothetical protein [Haloarcula amylovorans]|uniref:hypothetical protein n=1 Tax=Haloarcula amylovorans TaxID=2562280 RepID=UPI001076A462|nr:hypothetical protein [Halomicroarcula amylolytica]